MKARRLIGSLLTAILLSHLLIALPATAVLAASVSISPPSGGVDEVITISGTGFTANNPYTITFAYGTPSAMSVSNGIVSDNGEIPPTALNVPSIPGGVYTIRIESFGDTAEHVSRTFLLVPEIDLDRSYGPVGSQASIDGTGFPADKNVIVYFDSNAVSSAQTDETGRFSNATFTVPESYRGEHTVRAIVPKDESPTTMAISATDSYSIRESLTVNPASGAPGQEILVSGTGFKANRSLTISFDNQMVSPVVPAPQTDDRGSFGYVFSIPQRPNGAYVLEVSDGTNDTEADFTIEAGVILSPVTGKAGTELTVAGNGFSGEVTIKYDEKIVATTVAENDGDFEAVFEAPPSLPGIHTITITDGVNTQTTIFTVASLASASLPTPIPLSPEIDTETGTKPHFKWQDAPDAPLPLTYTLQVASDQDFTSAILEKNGLAESEYRISEAEELTPGGHSAPYYWRIKAVDSTSDESAWSATQSFYVASTLAPSRWGLYILIGLGVLVIALLGFVLGRKTSYR
ncbi:hypothetical protein ACFLRP_04765 [Bacteroidota bacterium]